MSIDIASAVVFAVVYVVGWLVVGFAGVVLAVLLPPRVLRHPWLTWYRRWALHGLREDVVEEVRADILHDYYPKPKREKYDWSQGKYVGKCACGCGEPIYYYGNGRRPKYVNQTHREFANGLRRSPFG